MVQGDWEDITLGLEERMLRLADVEEFERAAELRDALEQLRRLMSPQLRLADLAHFHAVVITPFTPASGASPNPGGELAQPLPLPEGEGTGPVATASGRGRRGAPSEGVAEMLGTVQLFCIRGGRLVRRTRLEWPSDRGRLGPLIRGLYRGKEPRTLTPEAAAEATVVAGWLRQQQKRADTTVIEVDPTLPSVALAAIRADLKRRAAAYMP
jgi:excinuclease UvrABC nuclease subunit